MIKERFGKEIMTTNLDSGDLLVVERSLEPGPYLIIDWVKGKGGCVCIGFAWENTILCLRLDPRDGM